MSEGEHAPSSVETGGDVSSSTEHGWDKGFAETEPVAPETAPLDAAQEIPSAPGESAFEGGVAEAPLPEGSTEWDFGQVGEESAEKSDDFTTDTLAELYIGQGFYEKAIEIYERMLADKPTSQGLKDKLDAVRAMAAEAPAAPVEEGKAATDLFAEPREYVPPPPQEELTTDLSGAGEHSPPAEAKEWTPPTPDEGEDADSFPGEREYAPRTPVNVDFEPREYVPPSATTEAKSENVSAAEPSTTAGRKRTIERLESWLNNIKKED